MRIKYNGQWVELDKVGRKQYSTDGKNTILGEKFNHAITASGVDSHAEGYETRASGYVSHAEGYETNASGYVSHAEGLYTTASGAFSHAEGSSTTASGKLSHAEGLRTIATDGQHVQGKYNIMDTEARYAHIVGNGKSDDNRSNAHTLDWSGNAWFAGDVRVGGTNYDDATPLFGWELVKTTGVKNLIDLPRAADPAWNLSITEALDKDYSQLKVVVDIVDAVSATTSTTASEVVISYNYGVSLLEVGQGETKSTTQSIILNRHDRGLEYPVFFAQPADTGYKGLTSNAELWIAYSPNNPKFASGTIEFKIYGRL